MVAISELGNTPKKQLTKIDVVSIVARLGETVGRSLRAKIDAVHTRTRFQSPSCGIRTN